MGVDVVTFLIFLVTGAAIMQAGIWFGRKLERDKSNLFSESKTVLSQRVDDHWKAIAVRAMFQMIEQGANNYDELVERVKTFKMPNLSDNENSAIRATALAILKQYECFDKN